MAGKRSRGPKAKVLCVDDEMGVLEGLKNMLRKHFEVHVAQGGMAGLKVLKADASFEVLVSDLRMPGMSGVDYLARTRNILPEATRILLTGQADLESTARAVNDVDVFRILYKPCEPEVLIRTLEDAVTHHRSAAAMREEFGASINGSIKAFLRILALTRPGAFGRGNRIKGLLSGVRTELGELKWVDLESAAMLSQLGAITCPPAVLAKFLAGEQLTMPEQSAIDRIPEVSCMLIADIPRLSEVADIIRAMAPEQQGQSPAPISARCETAGRGLRLVADYDAFQQQGMAPEAIIETLRRKVGRYTTELLSAFVEHVEAEQAGRQRLTLDQLTPGMSLASDLRLKDGRTLLPRGIKLNRSIIDRVRRLPRDSIQTEVEVRMVVADEETA
ncbi:MAG: response regulator [Bradymonadia bacterium]